MQIIKDRFSLKWEAQVEVNLCINVLKRTHRTGREQFLEKDNSYDISKMLIVSLLLRQHDPLLLQVSFSKQPIHQN